MRFLSFLIFVTFFSFSQSTNKVDIYIEKYKDLAIEHMVEYGIPASITLSQGILESKYGESDLAVNANNHFGIKCHNDWIGKKSFHDDDEKDECFRKYDSVEDSFLDHSLFLKNKSRYSALFSLKLSDYKGWAKGLKKAGYATAPDYAKNLISLIERYYLYEYDKIKKRAKIKNKKSDILVEYLIKDCNDVQYVIAKENDTYHNIADNFGIWKTELIKYNDVHNPNVKIDGEMLKYPLLEGDRVYIQPKRRKNNEISFHVVKIGETMRYLSQLYAIKLNVLYEKNNFFLGKKIKEGDIIYLQKKNKK